MFCISASALKQTIPIFLELGEGMACNRVAEGILEILVKKKVNLQEFKGWP